MPFSLGMILDERKIANALTEDCRLSVIFVPDRTPGKLMGLERQTVVTTAIIESIAHCVVGGKVMGPT
jgi:hypothetical protein